MDTLQYKFKHSEEEIAQYLKLHPEESDSSSLLDDDERLIVADLKLR